MIHYDNQFHTLDISCDGASCGRQNVFDGEFMSAIAEAKEYGWIIRSQESVGGTDFFHYCSRECAET